MVSARIPIISLTPSDILLDKGFKLLEMLFSNKKYQIFVVNIDPLRFRGVELLQRKGSMSLVFDFL